MNGTCTLPSGKTLSANGNAWIDLVEWIYKQVDGQRTDIRHDNGLTVELVWPDDVNGNGDEG
jgi:hypothetical protein